MTDCAQNHFGKRFFRHALGALALPVFGVACHGQSFAYDASLGSLPSQQGWVHYTTGPLESNFSLTGGALVQADTSPDTQTQGYRTPSVAFDLASDEVVATARLQVISSGLFHPADPEGLGFRRAGWGIEILDEAGRYALLFVGSGGAFLLGKNSESSGVFAFDATLGFHDYVMTVGSSGAQLDIDGVERATLSFGQFRTDGPSGAAYMRIGDISGAWASSSRLEAFSFAVVPETHWSGLAAGAGLMGFVIWRGTRLGGIRVRQG